MKDDSVLTEDVQEDGHESDVELQTPVAERPLPAQPLEDEHPTPNGDGPDQRQSLPPSPAASIPQAQPVTARERSRTVSSHDADVAPPSPRARPKSQPASPNPHVQPNGAGSHVQRQSISNATSFNAASGHPVSVVLISSALEIIINSKEAKRSSQLKDSATAALDMIKNGQGGDRPREIFEPLKLACETKNEKLMIASLDCISKLISYSFFAENVSPAQAASTSSPPASPTGTPSVSNGQPMTLADLVTHTITAAYTESTPDAVSLQIVKALLALVLSSTILVHHSSLLKAVRTVYNVFLLSTDPINQMVAQGGLTQIVNHVFSRTKVGTSSDSPITPATADVVSDIHSRLAREGVILPRRKNSAAPSSAPGTPTSQAMSVRSSTNGTSYFPSSSTASDAGDDASSTVSSAADVGPSESTESQTAAGSDAQPSPKSVADHSLSMYVHDLLRNS